MKRKSEESSDKDEIPEFFLDKEEKNEQSKEKVPSVQVLQKRNYHSKNHQVC